MALALIYPEPEKGGRGKRSRFRESLSKAQENLLSKARTALRYSREEGLAVLQGGATLDDAYQRAILAQQLLNGEAAKMATLREWVPDLAARVEDQNDKLTLDEAMAILRQREERERRVREAGRLAVEPAPARVFRLGCLHLRCSGGWANLSSSTQKF